MTTRTLSSKPLVDYLATHVPYDPTNEQANAGAHAESSWWGMRTGTSRAQVLRWVRGNPIAVTSADRVATHLGVHPFDIWGDEWIMDGLLSEVEAQRRVRAMRRSGEAFGLVVKMAARAYGCSLHAMAKAMDFDHVRLHRLSKGTMVPSNDDIEAVYRWLKNRPERIPGR